MNLSEFATEIAEQLREKMGSKFTITVEEVLKNNDIRLTGVAIKKTSENMAPIVYLEEFFQQYQNGDPIGKIAEEIRTMYERNASTMDLDSGFFKYFALVEDKIFYKLINYEKNQELLKDVPHFRWHDLAVVFYYQIEGRAFGMASITIHDSHLGMWGLTAEEVYRTARRNMEQKKPGILEPIQKALRNMGVPEVDERLGPLYVLTNRERMFGASAMLYSWKIKELADRLQTNLLILPSSTHEVLLLPDEGEQNYTVYRQMVREVNRMQVNPEEILSFNLYLYNMKKQEIEKIN
jgi:hypothetical protein